MAEHKQPARVVLTGVRIRDEFTCPITYELMREPVIAADGHTYDRHAIETWFRSHHTSPKTGEVVDKSTLIPNHNMKRLIDDLIAEGGQGLYVKDDSVKNRIFELIPHKLLIMKCLGPPDSDWNERRFHVTPKGVLGGRRQPTEASAKSFVQFTDNTVSRRHFDISYSESSNQYSIRDLGSAGGTFVRIAFGKKHVLRPGMMLLLGKHQFLVSLADELVDGKVKTNDTAEGKDGRKTVRETQHGAEGVDAASASASSSSDARADVKASGKGGVGQPGELVRGSSSKLVVDDDKTIASEQTDAHSPPAPDAMRALSVGRVRTREELDESSDDDELDTLQVQRERLEHLMSGVQELMDMPRASGDTFETELSAVRARIQLLLHSQTEEQPAREVNGRSTPPQADANAYESDTPPDCASDEGASPTPLDMQAYARLRLTCFAPDMSPIQGLEYVIGTEGATIGRRSTNTIHFCHAVDDRFYGIDNSISAEHARILYDEKLGGLVIVDGSATKGSTNGTWQRISAPATESDDYPLTPKMEVLIGTVRFQVLETDTLTEQTTSWD